MTTAKPAESEPSLDFDDILSQTIAATGLSDFGDEEVLETFRRLAKSYDAEGEMTSRGRMVKRNSMIRSLTNRLRLQEVLNQHAEIRDESISGPIVIVGLPRSGTTKLHRLISADPGIQKLPVWRVLNPLPLPGVAEGEPDPRLGIAQAFEEAMRINQPELFAAHPVIATEPDEDVFALEATGRVYTNCSAVRAPSFKNWLDEQPFDGAYRWFRSYLQTIQYLDGGRGRPWALKAPQHMGFLRELFEFFPDATIVHCHRPAAVNIASYAAMITASRRSMCYRTDPFEVGQYALNFWSGLMTRYLRDRPLFEGKHRFIDISFRDITGKGPETAERIYAGAGIPLTEAGRSAMTAWEAANTQHKHGTHRYQLSDAGLTEQDVAQAFGAYEAQYAKFF